MNHLFTFLFTFLLFVTHSFSQGITFESTDKPWKELLQKASKENKIIFMDAYTEWCGPCKMMAKNTFPSETVGTFFNANFVNVKMEMEHGEGPGLGAKYDVVAYPTLLFLNSNGDVIHRALGYHNAEELLLAGKQANDPSKSLAALDNRYAKGERDADFLYNYLVTKYNAADKQYITLADEYLKTQGDFGSEKNMDLILKYVNNPYSDGFGYFIKHKEVFAKKYTPKEVYEKTENTLREYLSTQKDMPFGEIEKLFLRLYPEDGARRLSGYKPTYYRQKGDRENYAKSAIEHFKKYPSNSPDELNEAAWTFFKAVDDKKQLKQAVKWSKKSVKLDNSYYNNDTLAALYYKIGNKKQSKKVALHAIELAKASGEDASATQELLEKILKL